MSIIWQKICETCGRTFYAPDSFHVHSCSKDILEVSKARDSILFREFYDALLCKPENKWFKFEGHVQRAGMDINISSLRCGEIDTSGFATNLEEMNDEMFIVALECAASPMENNLMRKLCLEAAKRLKREPSEIPVIVERLFPVCDGFRGRSKKIPWSVAAKAYVAYATKHSGGGQSLERVAERGGFYESELDLFYPKWREESDEIHLLRKENAELKAAQPVRESGLQWGKPIEVPGPQSLPLPESMRDFGKPSQKCLDDIAKINRNVTK